MVRLSSLPDLSLFVVREDPIKIYNTVNFLVGEVIFEVNGLVISRKSERLLNLVKIQQDIYLDEFAGEEEGIQDCIELLYGGFVDIGIVNIKTILKFAAINGIEEMFIIGMDWIKGNISTDNLYELINLGLLIQKIEFAEHENIIDFCKTFIKENVQGNLVLASKDWTSSESNIDLIKFFIQDDLLCFTLPVLKSWIRGDSHIAAILEEFKVKNITLNMSQHGERSLELLDRMAERVELLETSKKIIQLQKAYYKPSYPKLNKQLLNCLLAIDYTSFSIEGILPVEEEYNLKHYQYVDVLLHWLSSNNPTSHDFERIWKNIMQTELTYNFSVHIRNAILQLGKNYSMPYIQKLQETEYEYRVLAFKINNFSPADIDLLLSKQTVTIEANCEGLGLCSFKIRIDEARPSYNIDADSRPLIKHWYVYSFAGGRRCYYSLITNGYTAIIDMIRYCIESGVCIKLVCLFKNKDE